MGHSPAPAFRLASVVVSLLRRREPDVPHLPRSAQSFVLLRRHPSLDRRRHGPVSDRHAQPARDTSGAERGAGGTLSGCLSARHGPGGRLALSAQPAPLHLGVPAVGCTSPAAPAWELGAAMSSRGRQAAVGGGWPTPLLRDGPAGVMAGAPIRRNSEARGAAGCRVRVVPDACDDCADRLPVLLKATKWHQRPFFVIFLAFQS